MQYVTLFPYFSQARSISFFSGKIGFSVMVWAVWLVAYYYLFGYIIDLPPCIDIDCTNRFNYLFGYPLLFVFIAGVIGYIGCRFSLASLPLLDMPLSGRDTWVITYQIIGFFLDIIPMVSYIKLRDETNLTGTLWIAILTSLILKLIVILFIWSLTFARLSKLEKRGDLQEVAGVNVAIDVHRIYIFTTIHTVMEHVLLFNQYWLVLIPTVSDPELWAVAIIAVVGIAWVLLAGFTFKNPTVEARRD